MNLKEELYVIVDALTAEGIDYALCGAWPWPFTDIPGPLGTLTFSSPAWASRERHRVEGREIHVVSKDGLAIMKRAAGRPLDLADLAGLGLGEE